VQTGADKKVRPHYRRWLNVEDANFDRATIYANDTQVWQNFDSMMGDNSDTQHQDKEWRFQDVDLSSHVKDGAVQVKYEIKSGQGLELGGWTLDDFCIVGIPEPICGDGVVGGTETCDDGASNSDTAPDACRSHCTAPACGDGVVDTGEACDDGNDVDDDACHNDCTAPAENPPGPKSDPKNDGTELGGCGCRTAGEGGSPWPLGLLALGLPLALARRRSGPSRVDIKKKIAGSLRLKLLTLQALVTNMQSRARARQVAEAHYDLGNDLYEVMLDRRMVYTCAYWKDAETLDQAQENKLELVCKKAGLAPGMRVLDLGCGFGGFAIYAAEKHGCDVVGMTISTEQQRHGASLARSRKLPVDIRLQDYRSATGQFDAVVSIGMVEHVGWRNHRTFMEVVHRCSAPRASPSCTPSDRT
jgi:MYXO-CTERM domain-containing protein